MRTKKQKIILIAKIVSAFFVLLVIGVFIFRDALLQKTIVEISHKIDRDYNSTFSIKKAQFEGITGIEMNDIILVPKQMDTLFRIEKIKTHISFWNLLTGTIQIESLQAKNGFIQLVKNEKGKNFDAFLPKKKD